MARNAVSYFVFHIVGETEDDPKPAPEWPPVEPSPVPPSTDPVPTVPPVTGLYFPTHYYMLN